MPQDFLNGPGGFTDAELQQLLKDPSFNAADVELLSPDEKTRLGAIVSNRGALPPGEAPPLTGAASTGFQQGTGALSSLINMLKGGATGAVKGAAGSLQRTGLGRMGAQYPEFRFDPSKPMTDTTPQGTAERVGHTTEQVAEFLLPAGRIRQGAVRAAASAMPIPANASKGTADALNKLAAIIGRGTGEAGSAYGVASLHGDENPGTAAKIAGLAPVVGGALGSGTGAVLNSRAIQNPYIQRTLAALGASGVGSLFHLLFGPSAGIGATMGTYGTARSAIQNLLQSPASQRAIDRVAYKASGPIGRVAAGSRSESR